MNAQSLRFAYVSGPVDAVDVYEKWKAGLQLGHFGTSYLTQFYQTCSERRAKGYVIQNTTWTF